MHKYKKKILLLSLATLTILLLFLFLNLSFNTGEYIFSLRIKKIAAVIVAGYAIAISSILFQTITNNRILTPSIIGFDSLYLLIQGITVFLGTSFSSSSVASQGYFILNILLMIIFSELLYRFLFKKNQRYLYFILLAGVVCGMLFRSIFSFFMMLLDPNQFDILQDKMFASFNAIPINLLGISVIILIITTMWGWKLLPKLDVFLLGMENAHNLGINCAKLQKNILRIISIMVAIATALVGPITFLGLLIANIAYSLFNTYKHTVILTSAILLTWIALFIGLIIVEDLLNFSTNLTVILNGIGGVYFLYLLLKEGKTC